MSHEVESMAWTHQVPWHGLGAEVNDNLSYKEMLVAAGLDWTVSLRPTSFKGADGKQHSMKDRYVLARDSDDAPLSIAGGRYKPVQNEEALRFFDSFVKAGKAKMDTAGSLRGGKLVWGLAKLGADFKLPDGDAVKGYLLLASPHEVGRSLLARTTAIRVVCANTMAMATAGTGKFEKRFSHVRAFDADEAAELLSDAREGMKEFADHALELSKLNLTQEKAVEVLINVYMPGERTKAELKKLIKDEPKWNPTVRGIMQAYESAPGAVPGTGWGLLNGATYRMNHKAGTNADNRLASAWVGQEQKRTSVLMGNLLQLAA